MSSLHVVTVRASAPERARWVRRARLLAWGGVAWHFVEFAIAIGAGLAASSIALVGFGADSLIEATAGLIVVWRFAGDRQYSDSSERRAQQAIAVTFYLLAVLVSADAIRALADGDHAATSWVGIGLAAVTAPTMPLLARAKRHVGERIGSSATISEGAQNMLCAYLSIALLIGLSANAILGWWWADPLTALVIAAVALREGRQSWRGDACCASC